MRARKEREPPVGLLMLILLFAALAFFEVPGLVKLGRRRELFGFILYLLLAALLTFPQALGVEVPNPMMGIEAVFAPLAEWLKD